MAGGASLRPIAEAVVGFARGRAVPDYLAEFLPILGRFVPGWSASIGPEGSPVLVGEALLRLAAGQSHGMLLVLEDLHWADPDTLQVVEYLADHIATAPLALLATLRPDPGDGAAVTTGLADRNSADLVMLSRLSPDESAQLAAACLGVTDLSADLRDLIDAADGLPLLVEDLLADAAARDVLVREADAWTVTQMAASAPPSYSVSVAARLRARGPTAEQVLKAAAVLGREFDEALLCTVTSLSAPDVAAALRTAQESQLIEPADPSAGAQGSHRFRHALTRDAVLGSITATHRRSLASAAADASQSAGTPADLVAGLLELAGRHDEAATLLLEAADGEARIGTHSAGITLLARARSVAKDAALTRRIALAQVDLLAEAGLAREAYSLAREVLPFLPARESQLVRLRLAAAALRAQDPEGARRELDLVKAIGDLSDLDWAEVWNLEAGLALTGDGTQRVTKAEHLAHRAVAAAQRAGLPGAHCASLLVLGRCARLRDLASAQDAFRDAFRVADAAGLTVERVDALAELGTLQMMREVRADALEQALESAEVIGAPVIAVGIGVNLAGLRIMRGELDAAIAMGRRGQLTSRRLGLVAALGASLMLEGIAHGLAGDTEEMERLLAEAADASSGDTDVLAGSWAIGRATVAFLEEDRERARAALARANEVIERSPVLMIDPAAGPCALLGALEGVTSAPEIELAERRSGLGSAWTTMWIDCARAVTAGRTKDDDPAPYAQTGREAASRYPVFGLVADRLVAEAQLRDGWGDPLSLLADIEGRARERGYPAMTRAARGMQRAAGARLPRRRAVDTRLPEHLQALGVTAREAEVLDLLRDRLSNPEIADRLFLSSRTVEKHVANLLMKTGARHRRELVDIAVDPAEAPALRDPARHQGG